MGGMTSFLAAHCFPIPTQFAYDGRNNSESRKSFKASRDYSNSLDLMIAAEKKRVPPVNVLILGPSDSGKSTMLKQMKLIYGNHEFSVQEKTRYAYINRLNLMTIVTQVIVAMESLANQEEEQRNLPISKDQRAWLQKMMRDVPLQNEFDKTEFFETYSRLITTIAEDPTFNSIKDKSVDYGIMDSIHYWFPTEYKRVTVFSYEPTEKDILQSRVITSGIHEFLVPLQSKFLRIVDVGGARNQRKIWLTLFSEAHTVIYIASLSSYCTKLKVGDRQNSEMFSIIDALALFDSVINHAALRKCSVILFLNKSDLFIRYLRHIPLKSTFPEYSKGNNFIDASAFILKRFVHLNQEPRRKIFCHFTYATDRKQMTKILASVAKTIIQSNLTTLGLQ